MASLTSIATAAGTVGAVILGAFVWVAQVITRSAERRQAELLERFSEQDRKIETAARIANRTEQRLWRLQVELARQGVTRAPRMKPPEPAPE